MASTVAEPLETQFSQINGLAQMTSVNVLGTTTVTLQFDLDRNIDAASTDVLEAVNAAQGQLPKNLPNQPTIRKVNPADAPIFILAVQSDTLPLTTVDDYAENILSQQLSKISGVSQVLVGGQQKPAIRVQIDPAKLASMGLTLEDVRSVITNATVNSPKGSIDGPDKSYTVLDDDQLTDAAPYNDIVIASRNGAPVHIGDIGQAVRGPQNRELAGWQNGKHGVLLLTFKQPGANVIQTVERIKAALPALEASIPPSVHVSTIVDRTQIIRASVSDVEFTTGPVDRAGGDGDLPLPAQCVGDDHSQRDRAAGIGRHAGRDVPDGFQPRQSVTDGPDDRGRFRRRRRDRHAGEHLSAYRRRHDADGGRAQGRRRDRLHHRLDQPVADRGVHPAAAHGRYRRATVPRVRHDGVDHGADLGIGLADADAR